MNNLIIVLISIALAVTLATATFFYGGSSYTDNKIEAEATKLRNEAAQISGAIRFYTSKGNMTGEDFTLQDLVDEKYLSAVPDGWLPGDNIIKRTLSKDDIKSEHVCIVANKQAGFVFSSAEPDVVPYSEDDQIGIPSCEKENLNLLVPCCVE